MRLPAWDPQQCANVYHFRDKLRCFIDCRELKLNFQVLRLIGIEAMFGSWNNLRCDMSKSTNFNFPLWARLEPLHGEGDFASIYRGPDIPIDI